MEKSSKKYASEAFFSDDKAFGLEKLAILGGGNPETRSPAASRSTHQRKRNDGPAGLDFGSNEFQIGSLLCGLVWMHNIGNAGELFGIQAGELSVVWAHAQHQAGAMHCAQEVGIPLLA